MQIQESQVVAKITEGEILNFHDQPWWVRSALVGPLGQP
jgi:hypothetical protein